MNQLGLVFEKVGDISNKYSFMEIRKENSSIPLMEIKIDDFKNTSVIIYSSSKQIELNIEQMELISRTAKSFFEEEIKNESAFDNFFNV